MEARKRINVLGLSVILSLVVALSGCGLLLGGGNGPSQGVSGPVSPQQATLVPTITPSPIPVPTPVPTTQASGAPSEGLFVVPSTPGTPFTMEATDEQVNEYLAGQVYEQDGTSIRDIRVSFTSGEIIAQGHGYYQPLDLNSGVTARGVPVVSDGKVYLQVTDVAMDSSVPAFTRFLAELAIKQGIKQYSTPMGIEIPTEGAEISSIDVQPGKIIITGRTGSSGAERGA